MPSLLAILDASARISLVDGETGRELAGATLGPGEYTDPGALQVDPARGLVLVLTPFVSYDEPQRLVALRIDDLMPVFATKLPAGAGEVFRTTALSRDSIVAVGNAEGGIVISEVKLNSGDTEGPTKVIPNGSPHDWWVFAANFSSDESQLFVSYHGAGTGGTDIFERAGATWAATCPFDASQRRDGAGCIVNHGDVVQVGRSFFAATGSATINVYGSEWRSHEIDSGLTGNHLMRFVMAPSGDSAVALGSCRYVPGLVVLHGDGTGPEMIDSTTCGELAALSSSGLLAIVKNASVNSKAARPGVVVVQALRGEGGPLSIPVASEVADIAWIR